MNNKNKTVSWVSGNISDVSLVARMRLVLAISALLSAFIELPTGKSEFAWLVFSGYTIHTFALYLLTQKNKPFTGSKAIHWLDVFWYALMVLATGGSQSLFFPFFFFAILTASFRLGFEEGARIAVVSATLFFCIGLVDSNQIALSRVLQRDTFLLAFGYMVAYWGESEIALKRRLALLRDVSRLSNPRFGVDHTMTSVLDKTREFFRAGSCMLVTRDNDDASCSYRIVTDRTGRRPMQAERIDMAVAAPLLALARGQTARYDARPAPLAAALFGSGMSIHDSDKHRWQPADSATSEAAATVAELLEAESFISTSVPLRSGEGRLYIASRAGALTRADALFLGHIAAQAFPVIENIALLDRMATEAAAEERRRIARDLHDTTIQPYIGLELGLHAMRKKAQEDNPLIEDLERLTEMGGQVISELRRYAGSIRSSAQGGEPALLATLRRQAEQMSRFYGIAIELTMEGNLEICDRLAAEVFQMVSEGYSNIRKHTSARRGWLKLHGSEHGMEIEIGNEGEAEDSAAAFTPRSITERAAALGGQAWIDRRRDGATVVHIEIPA